MTASDRFTGADGYADVAVVVVTYNSALDLPTLIGSLRSEAASQRIRVIVADNGSTDGTVDVARAIDDVITIQTGGNLGYAGGINAALASAGATKTILVLNPDLVVSPGCISALRARMRSERAGIVVPAILDSGDAITPSLRFEPSTVRALGDAVFGGRMRGRPSALSETVFRPQEYRSAHRVEWATGAALLIDADAARTVGAWDERFFLYSEETDFFRRARDAGYSVWYEPDATVRHAQGGSGSSIDLDRLLAVNRIRYARKHHAARAAAWFRAVVVLHELARAVSPRHRAILRTVISERTWQDLPRARRTVVAP